MTKPNKGMQRSEKTRIKKVAKVIKTPKERNISQSTTSKSPHWCLPLLSSTHAHAELPRTTKEKEEEKRSRKIII
jgi:hypothetical protein